MKKTLKKAYLNKFNQLSTEGKIKALNELLKISDQDRESRQLSSKQRAVRRH